MYLLWPKESNPAKLRENFIQKTAKELEQAQAQQIRFTLIDEAVKPASKLYIHSRESSPQATVSFWLNSASQYSTSQYVDCENIIKTLCTDYCGYTVCESEPIRNTQRPNKEGGRTDGMNQVVLLKKPKNLEYAEWLDIWLNQHTQIAIDTQSTFGYRQNIVLRQLTKNALPIDAIVEENFPPEAMQSPHDFYNSGNDDSILDKHQKIMFESVQRFVDFNHLDCLPMSEYNF